jgi:tRNA pseudouridine38-40 synthase
MRLKLTIAYDGRPFCGWQSQAEGHAVQDHLERAFATLCGSRVNVQGAGRTDAGVHALAQVAHVDVPAARMPARAWPLAVNAHLPPEIRVLRAQRVADDFHAQFAARGKVYAYRLWNAPALHPLEIGRAWHVPMKLDPALLRAGAQLLEGRHDFARFAANRGQKPETTVRTIHAFRVTRRGPLIVLRVRGDGFLYRMVRLLTGSLVRCAQGKADLDWLRALLAGTAAKTHFLAPAEGLYLERVLY